MSGMFGGGHGQGPGLYIGLAIAVGLLLLRNRRPRALKIELLWVRPLIFVAFTLAALVASPPALTLVSLGLLALGLVVGAGMGWQRGKFIQIDVHPETHALTTRVSPLGLIFIVALVALRFGLRGAVASASQAHVSVAAAADALIVMVGAMMVTQGIEIWLRARRLLNAAKTGIVSDPSPVFKS